MLRDRLQARLAAMGETPDYVGLAEEVLGIRNATPALARRFVEQALVIEDRRESWTRVGDHICALAPSTPGVYVLREGSVPLYVGKAINLRRRLQAHFANRRWRNLPAALSRVTDAEWYEVGSELEALLREAEWIHRLQPRVNTQVGEPSFDGRAIPRASVHDTTVVLPSVDPTSVELVAARVSGATLIQRTPRDGGALAGHARRLWRFYRTPSQANEKKPSLSPIVYSWLAGRGASATRIDTRDLKSASDLASRLATAFRSNDLFAERLIVRRGWRASRPARTA